MHYEEYRPESSLTRHVHCYWFLSGFAPVDGPRLEPIVPDGRMELVLNLGDRFMRHHRDGSIERQPACVLAGQITGCVLVEPSGTIDLVGIRFRPAGAAAWLGVAPAELREQIIDPALAAPDLARDLADRLHGERDVPARLRILNRHFSARQRGVVGPDPAVAAAVDRVRASHGCAPIGAIATQLGMNRRTLERRFQAAVGIAPKRFARITRFQHALRLMQTSEPGTWTRVAYRCGYSDQAHLNRDFRAFAGASPARFFAGETTLADFFVGGADVGDASGR